MARTVILRRAPGANQPIRQSLLAALVMLASANWALAAEPTGEALFDAQLAAGEFAPARQMADRLEQGELRDAMLVKLAAAQAQSGATSAAYTTLASVGDDRVRSAAIKSTREVVPAGSRGGSMADFEPLIELITTTVAYDTWEETVGGPGQISEFVNGVYVDADGVLKRVLQAPGDNGLAVARLEALKADLNTDPSRHSQMRKVSLTRLEKHVQLRLAQGRRLSDDMLHLAGLEKIKYVLVYPETGDLVLAGPASDWRIDDEGRAVSRTSGRPVLQLDDLVVLLRHFTSAPQAAFGCSINPTQQGLARTRAFAEQSSAHPIKPSQRSAWLAKLRNQMGRQTISVEGIDPRTRAARVLVEADYRMKLVGMGLEEGTHNVPSYLQLIQVAKGEAPPPLDVLRWWFTLKYDAVRATDDRDAFEILGPGVQVLSENELLTALGEQVHTGKSDPLNAEFAARFTKHFAALAEKYPVYADLQNVFDLALVSTMIRSQGLADRVNWHLTCFLDPDQYHVALGPAPQSVDTVINHRVINGKHIVVGVSGGVRAEPWRFVSGTSIKTDDYGALEAQRAGWQAGNLPLEAWWWD